MKWIGLTGGIGTGKSSVAEILIKKGIPVVDADQLARAAVQKGSSGLKEIEQAFGRDILDNNGELNRKALGAIIFSDPSRRDQLEKILHPRIQELRGVERKKLASAGHKIAVYDVPLLFEKKMQGEFDSTILVYCSEAEQRRRIADRDHLPDKEITQRIQSQMPIDEKRKLAHFVISNQGTKKDLEDEVERVINHFI